MRNDLPIELSMSAIKNGYRKLVNFSGPCLVWITRNGTKGHCIGVTPIYEKPDSVPPKKKHAKLACRIQQSHRDRIVGKYLASTHKGFSLSVFVEVVMNTVLLLNSSSEKIMSSNKHNAWPGLSNHLVISVCAEIDQHKTIAVKHVAQLKPLERITAKIVLENLLAYIELADKDELSLQILEINPGPFGVLPDAPDEKQAVAG